MMKFENTANVGDLIKAYDFKPREGRPDYYLIGEVIDKGVTKADFTGYTVKVLESPQHKARVGLEMYIPYEIPFECDEWDTRIERIGVGQYAYYPAGDIVAA